ncbi:DNA-directed RNA polymerase subunit beta' [Ureaplasma zalophigenitalium]|uniref:DNA-directed RNA polymerase subunit beta' n=2 Tax=Ureaplasma zalophigenitalium TaxID=907723 RepID=A0ABT3BP13_9BACT|nr:DNA-directed RNA polymerase subunit beta' [Ureaplasma zalophigenitalium]MCV3753852.1 DNA-directed RNA polymerase subunit beta' [Ureaplasma zalophigenitalium]
MKRKSIKSLKLGIASPEQILKWSYGEVTKPETINYKSLKPEPDGLFDEKIFGPSKDYECYCGKYRKVKHKGKTCERCGVEITEAIVRRERMGHIELASPVAHIWFTKELPSPSKISLLLDITYKEVDQVVYFVNYIVLDEGHRDNSWQDLTVFKKKEVLDLTSAKNSITSRNKLRRILRNIQERIAAEADNKDDLKENYEYRLAVTYDLILKDSNAPFSIKEIMNFIKDQTGIRFGIGAEAIRELLANLDLEKEHAEIKKEIQASANANDQKTRRLLRRLECVRWIKDSGSKPEWMILTRIPITPSEARPIISLDGGRFTTSDINTFYRKIIIRNERLKTLIGTDAPDILLDNEKRLLQEAVDSLFDNNSRKKPVVGKDKRPLKSLSNHLKGKQGLFRQNLLGKRVDYSGRSVIVVGPELKMYEVGIPALMILKLFRPFIISELIRKKDEDGFDIQPICANIKIAEQKILEQDAIIWPVVEKVIKQRPVILNRAPTLHRLGIQAFEVKMVDGKAIRLHPLVTTAFNADFDGDQMAVHIPLSKEAVAEARSILLASWHILGPKDGKPIITPTQDMVLGIYYLTKEKINPEIQTLLKNNPDNENIRNYLRIFASQDEAIRAYEVGNVNIHQTIGISTRAFKAKHFEKNGILITTVGKIIFNQAFPIDFPYINSVNNLYDKNAHEIVGNGESFNDFFAGYKIYEPLTKKTLSSVIDRLYKKYELEFVPQTMDKIKALGFKYSMISATSISAFDIPSYDKKYEYFKETDHQVAKLKEFYLDGKLTDDERYTQVVAIWSQTKDKVTKDIEELIKSEEYAENPIVIMAKSGARGNTSNFTQLAGMRGLMSKSYNYDQKHKSNVIRDTIEIPIKHSFIEGLSVSEYFNSSFGARKGMTDTAMKTAKSGYMTRKLVDSTQSVVIHELDCNTRNGILVREIRNTKENVTIEPLSDRIVGRYAISNVYYPNTRDLIVGKDQLITLEKAKEIEQADIKEIEVRSPLHCLSESGLCQKCFGIDLSTNKLIEKGTAIGVIAAQSIGEPGTQLTMRTFHTGGVAGDSNITQGFERIKQLFDCIQPQENEKALISEVKGRVVRLDKDQATGTYEIEIAYNDDDSVIYTTKPSPILRIKLNDEVTLGQKLADGSIDVNELLKTSGIENVRHYIIKEVQKVYRLQGIEISDKYIEVIIAQLTNKLTITNPGDSGLFVGETVTINHFNKIAQQMLQADKTPPVAINQVFGLDHAPAKLGSFLSAASFQDTKKTLTDAAARSQRDYLLGLKENVILGNLIPAGTGLKDPSEVIAFGEEMYAKEY